MTAEIKVAWIFRLLHLEGTPAFEEERLIALSAFESVLHLGGATYASCPITSGRRLLRAHIAGQPGDVASRECREANLHHAHAVLRDLKARGTTVLIDPTRFNDVPGWHQFDYLRLWLTVIGRHVSRLILLEDWQFSKGCATEFCFARALNLPCLSETLTSIDTRSGIDLIADAVLEMKRAGFDCSFHELLLSAAEEAGLD